MSTDAPDPGVATTPLGAALAERAAAMLGWRRQFAQRAELAHDEHRTAEAVEAILGSPDARFGSTGLLYRVGGASGGAGASASADASGGAGASASAEAGGGAGAGASADASGGAGAGASADASGGAGASASAEADAVVVRAELDALAVRVGERTAVRHVCGHDAHLAALCGLVAAARTCADTLARPLWAAFQPSEEAYPSGAAQLADSGLLRGARAIVGCHVHPDLAWGQLALTAQTVNAACDNVRIVVEGTAGHAGYPHRAADPVLAISQLVVALHAQLPRAVDPLHPASVGIGLLAAGSGPSSIPSEARLEGTLRSFDAGDRVLLRERLETIAHATAAAAGCTATVELDHGEPALVNDRALAAEAVRRAPAAGFDPVTDFASCGADDFAYLGGVAPLLMAFLGIRGAAGDPGVPLHHPAFSAPDDAVLALARALALLFDSAAASRAAAAPPPERTL